MCGIIGYVGYRPAQDTLVEGLARLEYRGYDSAGISLLCPKLKTIKVVGELQNLRAALQEQKKQESTIGCGHTRWATHGRVNERNAHPHVSCDKKIAIVHNGIVENYQELQKELMKKGHVFTTDTDSEVFAHLIEEEYSGDLHRAVVDALKKIKGSYALVVLHADHPDMIVGARNESPLLIGCGDNENLLASDATALLEITDRVIYLEDHQTCVLTAETVDIYDEDNKRVEKKVDTITWSVDDAKKGGYEHFMIKEINEQPDSISHTLQGRFSEIDRLVTLPAPVDALLRSEIRRMTIIACGTSYYAGLISRYAIEQLTRLPTTLEIASEYRYFGLKDPDTLAVFITQSGETTDTLAAIRKAKENGGRTLVITNVVGSTATRIADAYLLMQCGLEIGVAATKTFTSQIMLLRLIALRLASIRDTIGADELTEYFADLKKVPKDMRSILSETESIRRAASLLNGARSVFFIGRGQNYPLALEGALKLKEISYLHAEGFAAGEMKHGPFALLTTETPIVAIVTPDETYDKILANIGEVKARGSPVIAIAQQDDERVEEYADLVIRYPVTELSCFPISVILQLLSYETAVGLGCNVDKPRNLAKSVTVE